MRTLFISIGLLAIVMAIPVQAQRLEDYISEGMKSNLVLQQKSIAYEKAMLALRIANGMFLPNVSLLGNYTHGDGGRSINIPVGDMLNPVYATLNQLTDSDQFPQIENVSENFFPRNFYDARVRASVPIINAGLVYNKKIQEQQAVLAALEIDAYKRELVRDIKSAYYHYLSAMETIAIYDVAIDRANEGKRVNESLVRNGKAVQAYVVRSESELERLRFQKTEAEKQGENARMYFNFLLNRESNAPIVADGKAPDVEKIVASTLHAGSAGSREELKQARQGVSMQETALRLQQSVWLPKLSGFVDVGSQGADWQFNNQSQYYLAGLQLDVPLFTGFVNRNRLSQSKLDVKSSSLQEQIAANQISISTNVSINMLITQYEGYLSSRKQLDAAESYQRLIERGYREGVNTFMEALDARSQLTSAQLQVTIQEYRTLTAIANVEREQATYPIN